MFDFISNFLLSHRGDKQDTRGTAFVVYEDIYDAKNAVDHLSGFNVCNRYLIVLYYQQSKMQKTMDNNSKRKEIGPEMTEFGSLLGRKGNQSRYRLLQLFHHKGTRA